MADMEDFLVRARNGAPIPTPVAGEYTSLQDIAKFLNHPRDQAKGFDLLGITLFNDSRVLLMNFREESRQGNRNQEVHARCSLEEQSIVLPLPLEVDLHPYFEMGVNFLGRIKFKDPQGDDHTVPLLGAGSVVLDPRRLDSPATFCTTPEESTFQQRVALCYAIASACGMNQRYLTVMEVKFAELDQQFHGRPDILEYTYLCCRRPSGLRESYLHFMMEKYKDRENTTEYPPMLRAFRDSHRPLHEYYVELRRMFPDMDLAKETEWWRSSQNKGLRPASAYCFCKDGESTSYNSPFVTLIVGSVAFTLLAIYLHKRFDNTIK